MKRTVACRDGLVDEGQESFEIQTERAIYRYHKQGCAFSSLIDRDGNDWIGYHPKGKERGDYRGIPNMGYNTFGHPGYVTGQTELLDETESSATLKSTAAAGAWEVDWSIYTSHAVMTAHRIAEPVWLLYEGTPGGKFNPQKQFVYWSDGTCRGCSERFREPTPDPKWVAFCDPKTKRSLAMAYDGPDSFVDTYWPMGGKGGMTVFGFGRTDKDGFGFLVETVPFTLSFALVESISFEEISAYVRKYLPCREHKPAT